MTTINSPPKDKDRNIIMSKNKLAPMAGNIPGWVAPLQRPLPLFSGLTNIDELYNDAKNNFNKTQC
jgi:hypothetical protein